MPGVPEETGRVAAPVALIPPDGGGDGTLFEAGHSTTPGDGDALHACMASPTGGRHSKRSVHVGSVRSRTWLKIDHARPTRSWSMPERVGDAKGTLKSDVGRPSCDHPSRVRLLPSAIEGSASARISLVFERITGTPNVSARSW